MSNPLAKKVGPLWRPRQENNTAERLRILWESLVSLNLDKTTTAALKEIHVVKHEPGSHQKIQVG